MNGEGKITTSHRDRIAIVYLRQSTMLQVRDHTESTMRQYALADLARELGWPGENVVVIDADLGVSGQFGTVRDGFREVVSKVCLGEVGAVFGLRVQHGLVPARKASRGRTTRWCIPWTPENEAACRQQVADSVYLKPKAQLSTSGGAV